MIQIKDFPLQNFNMMKFVDAFKIVFIFYINNFEKVV